MQLNKEKHEFVNKYMSNIPTSNIKFPTSNSAITLVALVITIIILLILAGVTLNMVMGDSGIFGKANSAKEQTQLKTAEDTIKLAVLDNRTLRETGDASALSNENLKVSITEKLRDLGYNVAEDNNIVTYYEDKTIKIEDYLGKEDNQGGITAQEIKNNPETYYGLKVTDYTSKNGQNDWRIFYSDGEHIFLITGDYIDTTATDRINSATGMTTSNYSAYWNPVPAFQTVDSTTLTRFKATEYALQSGINNSKCVSTLLNDNNWTSYLDEEINGKRKAEKAIGSPTVEMWMDSWNARYPKSSDQIYRKASTSTSNPGYYVGISLNPTTTNIDSNVMSEKEGYNNKLYYPHMSGYNGTDGYWLASPSAGNSNYVLYVHCGGYVSYYYYSNSGLGVRPVVCLNSGITVNAEDAQ